MDCPPIRVLISTLGSFGDMHPFLALGRTLRARGHEVRVIAPAMYEELTRSLGLEFSPVGSVEQFERFSSREELWKPATGFKVIAEGVGELLEPYYRAILEHHDPGRTVQVLSSLLFSGRVAQEVFGIPSVSVHLSPSVLRSEIDPAYTPPLPIAAWQPIWFKRLIYRVLDRLVLDPALGPPINRFRASLGLRPEKKFFGHWLHSPDRVIGLFPEWFAKPPADWPPQTVLTGFPLYDEADVYPIDRDLLEFLEAGDAPIAFTPGSAMRHGREFFGTAVAACQALGRRGLLLSRYAEHIPLNLPPGIRHVVYAPFSRILPRCSAVVHHGGIGTSSQGLAAGVPQVVVPMTHDQPDNARLLVRLGVAETVPAKRFNPASASRAMMRVLQPECVARCKAIQKNFEGIDPLADSADWVERTYREHRVGSSAAISLKV